MMFDSNVENMIKWTFRDDVERREEERMDASYDRLKMLWDNFKDEVAAYLKTLVSSDTWLNPETNQGLKDFVDTSHNVYKTIMQDLAMVYKTPPTRRWGEKAAKEWEEIYTTKMNLMWKKANVYLMALNDIFLYVDWRMEKIAVDILTPNILRVIPREDDRTEPDTIMIKIYDDLSSPPSSKVNYHWDVWTEFENYLLINNNGQWFKKPHEDNEGMINPYEVLPFVKINKSQNETIWNETEGSDLYDLGIMTAAFWSIWNYNWLWHNFKQGYVATGDDLPAGLGRAPDKLIKIPLESTMGVLDWSINTEQLQKDIVNKAAIIAAGYGVDLRQLLGEFEESGRKLKVKQSKLKEQRENQVQIFEDAEINLSEVIKVVYRYNANKDLSGELAITYPEMDIDIDPLEKIQVEEKEVAMGKKSLVDIYIEENPSATREEAMAKLKQNIQENNELNELKDESINDELNRGENG